ncbi:AGAP009144-PA-like protein [Anopheles sinensis]|uniref:AGAP009144-PA-like protein n=1 Tax=Anopheles sinensis TaxID=74873 RepID=A0A084WC42_ANOSI|nr:AGAP009144-PA-like protein [Anopheles sinensis]
MEAHRDTASPTDTACSSESPAYLGASSSHLLLYDQNSSEEELECQRCAQPDRGTRLVVGLSDGGIGIAVIDPHDGTGVDEDDDEDERTEEILADGDDDEEADEEDEEEEDDYRGEASGGAASSRSTPTAMATATTIIGSAIGAMDTSSSNSGSALRGQFVPVGGGAAGDEVSPEGIFGRSESVDDFSDELAGLTGKVSSVPVPVASKLTSTAAASKRFTSVGSLLEKRKRALAHNSDDELQTPLQAHHQHSHQHHHHHHHQAGLRQQHPHQPEQHPEDALLSAPVNFRTSPPLEALKPHRGHIIQRSTTPLVLTEGGGATGVSTTGGTGLLLSAGAGNSGFYGTGSGISVGGGGSVGVVGGLRFGLGRRPIGCDSPLSAAAATGHRNSTNQPTHGGCSGTGAGSGHSTTTTSTASSSLSAASSLARLGGSPSLDVCSPSSLVTNMDVSRSVSPPAKMFHCAVSPRRRQPRHHHQQHQRLQRPHRPCLDFDKMQQLKARSVTTWRHSNEHSGELSVFCW